MIESKNSKFSVFSAYLEEKHYADGTISRYCSLLDRLSVDGSLSDPQELFEHINKLLGVFRLTASRSTYISTKAAAGRYFEMITGKLFLTFAAESSAGSVIENILDEFQEYSAVFKKISIPTVKAERSHIRTFLSRLEVESCSSLSAITAYDVRDYATETLAVLKASSARRYITSLRNFFRFLEYKGISVSPSVPNLPLSSADRGNGKVPVILSPDKEKRLRTHEFSDDERGSRNKAILLFMLDLGLRCAEIPNVRLSDIRWSDGTIIIRGSKNNAFRELPLSEDAGQAAEDYILRHRPHTQEDRLFLNVRPCSGHSPVTVGTVRSLIRYLYKTEEITGWWKGAHAIRRTTASRIYNAGNSLKSTADILGHESIHSTTHYVKVDLKALSEIPREWPEEVVK